MLDRVGTFVLVHGAFHGGWCWRRVADRLLYSGNHVYTPTQTGLGERAHLLDASVGLDTFIQDVVSIIEAEELEDVILTDRKESTIDEEETSWRRKLFGS